MTDNEIIKALECCWHENECIGDECPLFKPINDCTQLMAMEALDLINRQRAEIKALKASKVAEVNFAYRVTKEKAIKEFAERLKQSAFECDVSFGYGREHYTEAVAIIEIDNLVKEMTEGSDPK
ncbi:MAG: hypothetical protein E7626_01265 [Ruminococcaceae bacterium]|nr:hypothetical protein [Oscillospiraceae bacterium]